MISRKLSVTLLLLSACSGSDDRTAFQLELTADVDDITAYADTILVIVDPESPFVDEDGTPLEAQDISSSSYLFDYNTDDEDLELVISVSTAYADDGLPIIELRPGLNDSDFTVTAHGFLDLTEYLRSDDVGPLSFSPGEVLQKPVPLGLLDTPIGPCNDGIDGDDDGYTDSDDPDCVEGDEESGYGDTECNDGIDNDSDGLTDADDPECDDAADDAEAPPSCEDGEDDDGDGWVD